MVVPVAVAGMFDSAGEDQSMVASIVYQTVTNVLGYGASAIFAGYISNWVPRDTPQPEKDRIGWQAVMFPALVCLPAGLLIILVLYRRKRRAERTPKGKQELTEDALAIHTAAHGDL